MKRFLTAFFVLCTAVCGAQERTAPNGLPVKPKERAVGERFNYGPGENQWLNLYRAEGAKPTPVYIWGHPNSDGKVLPSANDIPKNVVDMCRERGITVISWESVPQVKSYEDVMICRADLLLVYKWVSDNAAKLNLDVNNLFIGGSSRGTVVSWDFVCKYPDRIRGAYLAQALPKGAWAIEAENPLTVITADNPPVTLSYRTDMESDDGHSPKFGKRIADKYAELGIADRITLLLEQKNLYSGLIEFIEKHISS
ncbi:hypothetical protein FACS1894159_08600 [Bacteroidia bacterium]|nr:hypothetical protein FACS1894159_08600 [Bacteroidia bacterium]